MFLQGSFSRCFLKEVSQDVSPSGSFSRCFSKEVSQDVSPSGSFAKFLKGSFNNQSVDKARSTPYQKALASAPTPSSDHSGQAIEVLQETQVHIFLLVNACHV